MSDKLYLIDNFYPNPNSNGYGKEFAFHRFSILSHIKFNSVLDVGSGPCFLLEWLKEKKSDVQYEATDIRPDSLYLCKCKTYLDIPDYQYDLVCMYGTLTYNKKGKVEINKHIISDLLYKCFKTSKKYVIFSVMKRNANKFFHDDKFVYFTENDILSILSTYKYKFHCIDNFTDIDEFIVIVSL